MNNKSRIICFTDSLGAGGAQRQLVGLAVMLKQNGYDVKVAYYHDYPFYEEILDKNNVYHELIPGANNAIKRIPIVMRYFKKESPDWIIAYQETPSLVASVSKLLGCKSRLIVSERNTTQHTGSKEKIRFNLFRLAENVVPNAFAQADYIINTFPFLADKVFTIPNFVDLQYFKPCQERKRGNVPEILVVATIWAPKNTLSFIDAVAKLREKGNLFHIRWFGKDSTQVEYLAECQQKIEQLGLSEYIVLKEKSRNIREEYQGSDYFCLPSLYEGTPNVICEAMACGLPIACSDVCDNGRYVEEGVNGFLFNPHDTINIADALERMLSMTDGEYETYCHKSRERAEKMLSKDIFVESYIKLLEQ